MEYGVTIADMEYPKHNVYSFNKKEAGRKILIIMHAHQTIIYLDNGHD